MSQSQPKTQIISIELLDPHPMNYRKHEKDQDKLRASYREFGQQRNIVVRANPHKIGRFTILAGHGFKQAAQAEGALELECKVVPADWSDAKAAAYIRADNQSSYEDDRQAELELVEFARNSDIDLLAMGFTDEEFAQALDQLASQFLEENDEEDHSRATDLNEPKGGEVETNFSVLVECEDEGEQERAFNLLQREGFKCKLLTL